MSRPLGTIKYGLWHGRRVSPMPRAGRKATLALAVSIVLVMGFLVVWGAPAGAQEGNETGEGGAVPEGFVRTLTVGVIDTGCPGGADPCWDTNILVAQPGDNVVLVADMRESDVAHNLHVVDPIGEQTRASPNQLHRVEFQMPEDPEEPIEFICDVHPTTMVGVIATPAQAATLAAAGHGEEVHHLGVHFLAYWVGVIAFAILFVVYGITFFLFKYNETSATTDHWDRAGAEAPSKGRRMAVNVLVLALFIGAVAAAAMVILSLRSDISDLNQVISGLNVQIDSLTKELATAQEQLEQAG